MKKSLPRILTASGGNSLARLRPLICPIVRGHSFAQTRTHSCARAYARMHARRCARARKNAPKRASALRRVTHTVCSCSRAASEATLPTGCTLSCVVLRAPIYRPQRIGSRPDPPVDPADRPALRTRPPRRSADWSRLLLRPELLSLPQPGGTQSTLSARGFDMRVKRIPRTLRGSGGSDEARRRRTR